MGVLLTPAAAKVRVTARLEAWAANWYDQICGVGAAVSFGASSLVGDSLLMHLGDPGAWYHNVYWKWVLVVLGAVLLIISARGARRIRHNFQRVQENLRATETENAQLQDASDAHRVASKAVLERLAEAFYFEMKGGPGERLSAYVHNGKFFVRLVRVSSNPNLARAGRQKYPDDQGVVGKAWAEGDSDCLLSDQEASSKRAWNRAMRERCGLPRTVTTKISMQSRTLLARRVSDESRHQPVAVVVFESKKPARDLLHESTEPEKDLSQLMSDTLSSSLGRALAQSIVILTSLQPGVDPDVAIQEGFG